MTHVADPTRYDGAMRYRRSGRSGLDLPMLSLGFWHNFGDDRPFAARTATRSPGSTPSARSMPACRRHRSWNSA